ncbi:Maf family protein [Granulicella sibirica]|uniref:dTTP/UTP pyrophosphatase n=1 Tax=Granulicella sibirica TaxID=2479048 RepID=A0A4Q0T8S4_9BACT|nr:Maf family protein [Granulicella sibirica]RXH58568.1 Septum formation protein Maf [Granulicella sibirica]
MNLAFRLRIESTMLVLASASPRRKELLTQAGLTFTVEASEVLEDLLPKETAADYVSRLAEEKARAVFERRKSAEDDGDPLIVLGADTCVLSEGEILGKPRNREEARRMLQGISGRTHQVLTGIAAVTRAGATVATEISQVTVDLIDPDELETYLDTGEPLDKAGAYGIQGYAARWIPRIEGCYFNVVGLPIARTMDILAKANAKLATPPHDPAATVVVP